MVSTDYISTLLLSLVFSVISCTYPMSKILSLSFSLDKGYSSLGITRLIFDFLVVFLSSFGILLLCEIWFQGKEPVVFGYWEERATGFKHTYACFSAPTGDALCVCRPGSVIFLTTRSSVIINCETARAYQYSTESYTVNGNLLSVSGDM